MHSESEFKKRKSIYIITRNWMI